MSPYWTHYSIKSVFSESVYHVIIIIWIERYFTLWLIKQIPFHLKSFLKVLFFSFKICAGCSLVQLHVRICRSFGRTAVRARSRIVWSGVKAGESGGQGHRLLLSKSWVQPGLQKSPFQKPKAATINSNIAKEKPSHDSAQPCDFGLTSVECLLPPPPPPHLFTVGG